MLNEQDYSELVMSVIKLNPERLLNIALNIVSGRWNSDALAHILIELQQDGVNTSLSGFDEVALE